MGTAYSDVAHLLRRAGFDATPTEISSLASLELQSVVDLVLDTSLATPMTFPLPANETGLGFYPKWRNYTNWWIDRMASTSSTQAPLVEKMALFWHMHFTSHLDQATPETLGAQFQQFRELGCGDFLPLLKAVAVSPPMLGYLDNRSNTKNKPNENWARESMELFTLGVNEYSQADVAGVARAWTGHGLTNNVYTFTPDRHDYGNKTIFGITKNWNGPDVLEAICTGPKKSVVARFLANKLWSFFGYEQAEASVIDEIANVLFENNLNIGHALRAIFMNPIFYSVKSKQGHVRNPIEYAVAALKFTGATAASSVIERYLDSMGMRPWYPPNVAGWGPQINWINTGTMWSKGRFARSVAYRAVALGVLNGTSSASVTTAVQRSLDQFSIESPSLSTRMALESLVTAERAARSDTEVLNLLTAVMLTPEFQTA